MGELSVLALLVASKDRSIRVRHRRATRLRGAGLVVRQSGQLKLKCGILEGCR